jgi:hypothetical protein
MRSALFVALAILVLGVGPAAAGQRSKTVHGRVMAVSADTVTLAQGMESMTFACDSTTLVTSKGPAKASTTTSASGSPTTVLGSVDVGDNVSVTYTKSDVGLRASRVKINQKAS